MSDKPRTAEAEHLGKALAMAKKINDKAAEAVMMAACERMEASS